MSKIRKYKIVLVGDQNVGKTSIISRFINDTFQEVSKTTVGIDFLTKMMKVEGQTIRLQLWDTAGQQKFRSLIPSYVRDADICLIVIDINDKNSTQGINNWLDFVKETRGNDGIIYIVGNKMDLQRQIGKQQIEQIANQNNISYLEVSAKNSTNIQLLFRKISQKLVQKSKQKVKKPQQKLTQTAKKQQKFNIQKNVQKKPTSKCC